MGWASRYNKKVGESTDARAFKLELAQFKKEQAQPKEQPAPKQQLKGRDAAILLALMSLQ